MEIRINDLKNIQTLNLLREHHGDMLKHSPPESVHVLEIDELQKPDITFWSVWNDEEVLGCGALKQLDPRHGEIKSMRTSLSHRKKGVAKNLLEHILKEANLRGYNRVSLETGSMPAFEPARRLYTSFGFIYCEPFADYSKDPYSVFMTKEIAQNHKRL